MNSDGCFSTKVVGVTYPNEDGSDRQTIIRNLIGRGELQAGTELFFIPQPTNRYDPNCILVNARNGQTLGCLSREMAAVVAPQIRQGCSFKVIVSSVTGGGMGYSYGINLRAERNTPASKREPAKQFSHGSYSAVSTEGAYIPSVNDIVSSNPQIQELFHQAMQGDMAAQHNMGGCYMEGVGVTKDPVKAVYWFRKAAEQGSLSAQDNMGLFYLNGIGVRQDNDEALSWFILAANQGYADSQNNMGCCYMGGVGVNVNPGMAIIWWERAAKQRHPAALFNLGLAYLDGNGVEKSIGKALQYIVESSKEGHQPAIDFLDSL